MNIPAPTASQGAIANIEDGLYVARFNDITHRIVEEFKTDKDKFGKPDDGGRFDFMATILDEQRQPVLLMDVKDGVEDPTLEFDLRQGKSVKVISSDERSNSYALLKGILTASEFAAWLASTAENPVDLSHVAGREVNVQVGHNEKGYPQIDAFLGPAKPLKGAK
jgi:hypothetical protein